ncbi:MAG: dienelactone hydrolase family protein [Candidatus Limnocylindrales bacterium]
MAFLDYLTGEVAEDWVDGLISRRDALRRLALLGLSASAAGALLAACAAESVSAPPSGASGSVRPPASGGASGPAAASPPAAVSPSAAAVVGEAIRFAGPRGELQGFFAPVATPAGGMLVIHENRGLTDHIRSVASRLAGDGYAALAIDLLSEEGGTDTLGQGNVQAALANATNERLVGDMRAGLDELARRVPGARLGSIGFCFGGGMVWTLLDAGDPRLAVAIPFYGPAPDDPDFGGSPTAVLAVYAELDARVNASRDRARLAMERAGLTHEIKTYPGVDHAFFNDTGGRYSPDQAAAAYADVLAWLGRHLAG